MTDLLTEYTKHRDQGHGHHAALLALARRFDLDPETVGRVIERAQREHDRPGGRVKKFHDPAASPRQSTARARRKISPGAAA
jgi:hypothetical protein